MTGNRLAGSGSRSRRREPRARPRRDQLDFAGIMNVFDINGGDSPQAVQVIAGVGGFLTLGVLALAFAGAALAIVGNPAARAILIAAALAGLVTALPLWIPAGVVIGAAAVLLGPGSDPRACADRRTG